MDINAVGTAFSQMASALNNLQQYLKAQPASSGSGGVSLQLPAYSGSEDELVSIWILKMEEIFTAKNVNEDKKVASAVAGLSGGALSWYLAEKKDLLKLSGTDDQSGEYIKWEIFVGKIKEAFPVHNEQMLLRRMLRSLKQRGPVSAYAAQFRVLLGLIVDMNDFDAMMHFIEGLRVETKEEVLYRSPKSLKEAIRTASEFDSAFYSSLNMKRYFSHIDHPSGQNTAKLMQNYPRSSSVSPRRTESNTDPMEICNLQGEPAPYYRSRN